MKSGITVTGNFREKLGDLGRRAKELDGPHEVPLKELMPPAFVAGCSSFGSLEELFAGSPFKINSTDDFKAIPDADWDAFIQSSTSFASWREMQHAAVREWTRRKLGFK
jgi:hypothetical protein